MGVFHIKPFGVCVFSKIFREYRTSPESERAQKESNLLAAKVSWMRAETIIWAWTCLSWRIEVHWSARRERPGGFGGRGKQV